MRAICYGEWGIAWVEPCALIVREKEGSRGEFQTTNRAKFARLCIEVGLSKVLISKFEFNNRIYNVEYEGLHLVCFGYGRYGHKKETCPLLVGEKLIIENDKKKHQGMWVNKFCPIEKLSNAMGRTFSGHG